MSEVVVTVKQGQLRGAVVKNSIGGSYLHFRGIPYAVPPVGDLRFKDSQPAESWSGIRDALKEGAICAQKKMTSWESEGEDDCLYLNVATTSSSGSRPVMVWIHGGGFAGGCGGGDLYSPDYLVKREIVFVSINYRLNVFGFLNLHPELAPGNMGLKDQTLALKWVKENISVFGGDPNNVTIFGESAGGCAVHFHTISPLSKGLFHKAIAQSGVILNPWAWTDKNRGYELAAILGKETSDPREAVEFLRSIPAHKLVEAQRLLYDPEDNTGLEFVRPFVPTFDEKSPEPFIPRNFENLIEEGVDVPFIIGYTDSEGSVFLSEIFGRRRQTLNEDFVVKAPKVLIKNAFSKASAVSKELKEAYFGECTITNEHLDNYIQCIGDIHCVSGIQKVAEIQAKKQTPTYLYLLSYRGTVNIARTIFQVNEKGAMHFEDIGHLFYASKYPDHVPKEGTLDRVVSDRFVRMWTDFAKTGDPTPQIDDLITEKWKPITSKAMNYLNVGAELKADVIHASDKREAWKRIDAMIKNQ